MQEGGILEIYQIAEGSERREVGGGDRSFCCFYVKRGKTLPEEWLLNELQQDPGFS